MAISESWRRRRKEQSGDVHERYERMIAGLERSLLFSVHLAHLNQSRTLAAGLQDQGIRSSSLGETLRGHSSI